MHSRVHRAAVLTVTAILTVLASPAFAGNGTFSNGEFNYCVSVRFDASQPELDSIREVFQAGSEVLVDATDGQHHFGTIRIANDGGASQSSEYWVNSGPGRAEATLGRFGNRGEHVMLFFDSNFQATKGQDGDAYTVAHEHAHHAYGVLDEYKGPGGAAECAAGPDGPALNFCLMDDYFERGGRAGGATYTLNEFCTAGGHDPDEDTDQANWNGESCWDTISSHPTRSATEPTGAPTDPPPGAPNVTFEMAAGGLRSILLLDRSGSMSSERRLEFAKSSARQFANVTYLTNLLATSSDQVGVASFSDSSSLDLGLTSLDSIANLNTVKATVDGLTAGGNTNIGGGLLSALGALTSQPDRSCNEVIVLLSDGDHNTGTAPSDALDDLQSEGVTVLSVGLGDSISTSGQATLQDLASSTGGQYFRVSNSFDLVGLFTELAFESVGDGLLTQQPATLSNGEVHEVSAFVEEGAAATTFVVGFAEATDDFSVRLLDPSGDEVATLSDAVRTETGTLLQKAGSGVVPLEDDNTISFFVPTPQAGQWALEITANAVTDGRVEALAAATHAGVYLSVVVPNDTPTYPEPIEVEATPRFRGHPVVDAAVAGEVHRPDGTKVPIELFDDGEAEHGDIVEGDGVYSNLFRRYNEEGTYTFDLVAESTAGRQFSGEDLFSFSPSNDAAVPAFRRLGSATAVVSNLPAVGLTQAEPTHVAPGDNVILRGFGLSQVTEVTSNGQPVTAFEIIDDESIRITVPPLGPGPVDVTVATSGSNATLDGAFVIEQGSPSEIPTLGELALMILALVLAASALLLLGNRLSG